MSASRFGRFRASSLHPNAVLTSSHKSSKIARRDPAPILSSVLNVAVTPSSPTYGSAALVRRHPLDLRPPDLPRGDAQGEEGEGPPLHLLQLVIFRPRDPKRAGDRLPHQVPHAPEHGHAAVLDLSLAVALDVVEADTRLGKAEGVEVAGGGKGPGEAVARGGLVRDPAVDRGHDRGRGRHLHFDGWGQVGEIVGG